MKKFMNMKKMVLTATCAGLMLCSTLNVNAAPVSKTIFDVDYYYNTYADLQAAFGYDEAALYNHYVTFGIQEGRSGSEEFNCSIYAANYADLRAAFGGDIASYCMHYEQNGQAEGRIASERLANAEDIELTGQLSTDKVLGSYSTTYKPEVDRSINLRVASSRINGLVFQPGDSFSFSRTILPRNARNGYVKANIISNGEYVEGYGGGICQVSSTLYNAMLVAGLPATERHSHSLDVSYVPRGMDATIAGTYKDLKFVNVFDKPIKIEAVMDDTVGVLTVSIIEVEN